MHRSRILIADDHILVAELCKKVLEPEFEVIGIVSDGLELVRTAAALAPDVTVVDIAMPSLSGLDAAQQIKQKSPAVKVIFLTMNPDPEVAAEAFRKGASGYLLKTSAARDLVASVRDVLRGKSYLSTGIPKDTVDFLRRQRDKLVVEADRLTERQREVLQLLVAGKEMKEIAGVLNMSTRTVAFHKYRIMEVLGAKSISDLIKYAVRNQITSA
jgi:DNA-binding NarL/FixJ family response regulator